MKKILVLLLIMVLSFGIVACRNGADADIPSLDKIVAEQYTDDEIEIAVYRVGRDELIKAWGQPDRIIEKENEDVWILNEKEVIVVSYNLGGKVKDVDIED